LDFVNHIILKKVSLFMPFLELLPLIFRVAFSPSDLLPYPQMIYDVLQDTALCNQKWGDIPELPVKSGGLHPAIAFGGKQSVRYNPTVSVNIP